MGTIMSSTPEIALPTGFEALDTEEKLRYLHRLWEIVADNADDVPVPSSHLDIVEQRREAIAQNPDRRRSYDDLRRSLGERNR